MSDGTKIQWSDATWNVVTGCQKVSEGCRNCYAERLAPRVFAGQTVRSAVCVGDPYDPESYERPRRFTDVVCHPDRLIQPTKWRKPRMVFVNSMSDLFHEDVPDEFIDQVFGVMAWCKRHVFQVLTKRPERMRNYCNAIAELQPQERSQRLARSKGFDVPLDRCGGMGWPLPNVWLGVSCEDQATANQRVPLLLGTPAAVRFVSAEPLLAPIDFERIVIGDRVVSALTGWASDCTPDGARLAFDDLGRECAEFVDPRPTENSQTGEVSLIHWLICGGESGPRARPCDVAWIRSIVSQCRLSRVPCFVKQLGANPGEWYQGKRPPERLQLNDRKGGNPDEWPEDLRVREWPQAVGDA